VGEPVGAGTDIVYAGVGIDVGGPVGSPEGAGIDIVYAGVGIEEGGPVGDPEGVNDGLIVEGELGELVDGATVGFFVGGQNEANCTSIPVGFDLGRLITSIG